MKTLRIAIPTNIQDLKDLRAKHTEEPISVKANRVLVDAFGVLARAKVAVQAAWNEAESNARKGR